MRILLLTNEFPLPQDAGGVRRQLGLCECLGERHELHLLARERGETGPAAIDEVAARLGGPVETFPQPGAPDRRLLPLARRWGESVVRRSPPWMLSLPSAALARRAVELAPRFDVAVTLDDIAHAYVGPLHRHLPVVLDKHNVQGASAGSYRPWGTSLPGLALQKLTLLQTRTFERRTCRMAAAVVVTSSKEGERFQRLYGWRPHVVPTALPPPPPALAADPLRAERVVIWIGDGRYPANVDGLVRFVREAWEPLGETAATLLVAGRDQPAEVQELTRFPGLEVLGYVNDVDVLIGRGAVGVVPLWAGAGIKMKTLTMLGAGLPVVGTPVGFEGIAARDGAEALVADQPKALAAGIARMLDDRRVAAEIGRRGRDLVLRDHTWKGVIHRFEAALAASAERGTRRRRRRLVESFSDG